MAWSIVRKAFGVCGNFKFEFYDLTDVKATRSLVKPMMSQVYTVYSTNTSDNADVLAAQTLNWTGTCTTDVENKIDDNGEVFDPNINGAQIFNTTDVRTSYVTYDKDTTDRLFCHKGGSDRSPATGDAAYDLAPDGNEAYLIKSERIVQVIAADAGDEGTLFIMGR